MAENAVVVEGAGDLGDIVDQSPGDVEVKLEAIQFLRELEKQQREFKERDQEEEEIRFYDDDDPQWIFEEPAKRPCRLPPTFFLDEKANAEQISYDDQIVAAEQHLHQLRHAALELRKRRAGEEQRQLQQRYAAYYMQQRMPFNRIQLQVAALLHQERHNRKMSAEYRHHQQLQLRSLGYQHRRGLPRKTQKQLSCLASSDYLKITFDVFLYQYLYQ